MLLKTSTPITFALSFACLVVSQEVKLPNTVAIDAVDVAFNLTNIPRDLNIAFNPSVLLDVTYPGSDIDLGSSVNLSYVQKPPSYQIQGSNIAADSSFLLVMLDPDAPVPAAPVLRSFRYFLGGNFTATPTSSNGMYKLVNSSAAVTEYLAPNISSTSPHRITWLLYAQPAGFKPITLPSTRVLFNISSFQAEVGLGDPIGGNFAFMSDA